MINPTLPGYKVECVGDDIAWMRFDSNGQLRAINPEAGFFGVAPGRVVLKHLSMLCINKQKLFYYSLAENFQVELRVLTICCNSCKTWRLICLGTSMDSNPMAMQTIQSNTIFTNVAKTSDGGVYWEDIDKDHLAPGATITSWKNEENWKPGDKKNPAAHPNSRYV